MAERKDPPCPGILELDRENLCVVDGVVFEKDSFQRYIREEHRPHPKKPEDHVKSGVIGPEEAVDTHQSSGSASFATSYSLSFAGSFSSFSGSFTSSKAPSSSAAGSAFAQGGYGLDLI